MLELQENAVSQLLACDRVYNVPDSQAAAFNEQHLPSLHGRTIERFHGILAHQELEEQVNVEGDQILVSQASQSELSSANVIKSELINGRTESERSDSKAFVNGKEIV